VHYIADKFLRIVVEGNHLICVIICFYNTLIVILEYFGVLKVSERGVQQNLDFSLLKIYMTVNERVSLDL